MGRLLTTTALILAASMTTGCYPCMQNSYYDPSCGVVYGPSVKPPTFLSGLKKHKHEEHSCPLCAVESSPTPYSVHGSPAVAGGTTACCDYGHGSGYPTQAYTNYGAAFGQPVPNQKGRSPSCACPSPQNCKGGCSTGKRSCNCRGKAPSGCHCSTPVADCEVCDPCQHQFPVSHCDTCSTFGDSYSSVGDSYPGVVYDESYPAESYSSEPMILPGETIMHGDSFQHGTFHDSGNCPHCQSTGGPTSGPIFEGTIIPGYETDKPNGPTPAPAAEPELEIERAPGETVLPEPDPLPATTTMMIPTFPAPKPARQVHWVPNTLK